MYREREGREEQGVMKPESNPIEEGGTVQGWLLCLVWWGRVCYVAAPSAVAAAVPLPFFFLMRFFLSCPCDSLLSPFFALRTLRGLGPLARFLART